MPEWNLQLLGTDVHRIKTTCRDKDPGSYLKGQGHKLGSKVKMETFCRIRAITTNASIKGWILKLFGTNVLNYWQDDMSRFIKTHAHSSNVKVTNQGQRQLTMRTVVESGL